MRYYNTYDKKYNDLTIEERIDIWKDYFNIFCVEEVVSDYPLRVLCEDDLTNDVNVYVRHYIFSDEYNKIMDRHSNLSNFVYDILCRGCGIGEHKLNIIHLFRDSLNSRSILEDYVNNEHKVIVYRKYCYC